MDCIVDPLPLENLPIVGHSDEKAKTMMNAVMKALVLMDQRNLTTPTSGLSPRVMLGCGRMDRPTWIYLCLLPLNTHAHHPLKRP
jgi:hypothetical protein